MYSVMASLGAPHCFCLPLCVPVCRLQRLVKDLGKQLQGQDSGQWANNKVSGLDRTLGEISRILEKQVLCVKEADHIYYIIA